MRRQKIQSLSVFTGSLLALAIVCSQLFNFNINSSPSKKEVKTEQESGHQSEQALISLPSFSLPTPVHVQTSFYSYCLFEIVFEKKCDIAALPEAPSCPTTFLTTLFRVIISPNAP
jgi:hypothetical protein